MRDHVLVVRFSSLGDVVLVAPVFRALKERLPEAHITFLTRSEYAGVHAHNPLVDVVWPFDPDRKSLRVLRRRIRESDFSLTVDLHGSLRSHFITAWANHPVTRVRKQRLRRFWLVARPALKRRIPLAPVVDRYLESVGAAGEQGASRIPVVQPGEEALARGIAWRSEVLGPGSDGQALVALFPGAKHPVKEWPWKSFLELGAIINREGGRAVALPPPDRSEDAFPPPPGGSAVAFSRPIPSPDELAGVLSACDGVVANDSGPMHLAAAVGTPVVGIFGPTSPTLGFAPIARSATYCHLGIACSPCSRHGSKACWRDRRFCLEDLAPEAVYEALKSLGSPVKPSETA